MLFCLPSFAATTNRLDWMLHFEGGSDGNIVTTTIQTNSRSATGVAMGECLQSAGASNFFTLSTDAAFPLTNWYWGVNGTNNQPGSLGLAIEMGNTDSQYLQWYWQSYVSNFVLSFTFRTTMTGEIGGTVYCDVLYAVQPFSAEKDTAAPLFHPMATPYWRAHGSSNGVSGQNGPIITGMAIGDTNQIVMQVTPTNMTLSVYDYNSHQQVGSNSSIGFSGTGKWNQLEILSKLTGGSQPGAKIYVDNVMMSTNADFPLLPWDIETNQPLALTNVQALVDAASSGDTITLGAGTVNWDGTLIISNKALTLRGAGAYATIITNIQQGATGSGEKQTVLIYPPATGCVRITALGFDGFKTNNCVEVWQQTSGFTFSGDWPVVRVDRCGFFNSPWTGTLLFNGLIAGVVDHCAFLNNDHPYNVYAGTALRNVSWTNALSLGTTNCIVVEDCWFTNDMPNSVYSASSITTRGIGSRDVFRRNFWTNSVNYAFSVLDVHGNNDISSNYGVRQIEVYQNTFLASAGNNIKLMDLRGGTCLIWSNTFGGSVFKTNFYAREEDYSVYPTDPPTTNYPGRDQHWLYLWGNTSKGVPISMLEYGYPESDPLFLIEGTNVFWQQPTSGTGAVEAYTPLTYPHPLVTAQDGAPAANSPIRRASRLNAHILRVK